MDLGNSFIRNREIIWNKTWKEKVVTDDTEIEKGIQSYKV